MKKHRITLGFLFTFITLLSCAAPQPIATPSPEVTQVPDIPTVTTEPELIAPADIIFFNGNVITIETDQPLAQAVAVQGQLIQAVGNDEEILALQGAGTELIDLQGHTLMPGFIDSHIHFTRNRWGMGYPISDLQDVMLTLGLTSVTEMHSTDEYINAMLTAEQDGQMRMRINIFASSDCGFLEDGHSIECPSWYLDNDPILDPTRMIRVPGVKIFVDGAGTPERGCPYYTAPYADTIMQYYPEVLDACGTPLGDLYLTQDQLTTLIEDIQARGYRAAFHVMGDAGLDVTLNSIEAALNGESNLIYRHQIQHNSMVRPDHEARYVELNILAGIAGQFNSCEANDYLIIFGPERDDWNGDRYDLPILGLHVSYQSDFNGKKVTDPPNYDGFNPIRGLFGLVTHKQITADGSYCEAPEWMADNTATIQRALEMVTIEGAYMVSMEDFIGSVKPGKFADLVILSDDPLNVDPDDIPGITVWMTMVGGTMQYCAEGKESYCPNVSEVLPITPSGDSTEVTQVKIDCDARNDTPLPIGSDAFLQTAITWAAMTAEQVEDFLANVHYAVYINGVPVNTSISSTPVGQVQGKDYFQSLSAFDVGALAPGKYELRTVLSFDRKFTDGQGWYGPNTENSSIVGVCTVIVGD